MPDEALQHTRLAIARGEEMQKKWQDLMSRYEAEFPEEAAEFKLFMSGGLPEGWDDDLPTFTPDKGPLATRTSSGQTINAIAAKVLNLDGGRSRPLPFHRRLYQGRRRPQRRQLLRPQRPLRHPRARHGRDLQGIALHKGLIAFGSTFLIFYDYMRPPLRLAAIMGNPLLMLYTHDSIGLGEDGPTHQPVEMLSGMRAVPNLWTVRPADANESVFAWKIALTRRDGPTALIMTRQKLPIFDRTKVAPAEGSCAAHISCRRPRAASPT